MKICYVYEKNLPSLDAEQTGIDRKVFAQIKLFQSLGWETIVLFPEKDSGLRKMAQALPLFPDNAHWERVDETVKADVFYIRRPLYCSKQFINLIRGIRSNNQDALLLYEIPTYPYDKELETGKYLPVLIKDRLHRQDLSKYIDRVVDLSGTENIFGVETIQIFNGVDLSVLKPRSPSLNKGGSVINIMCVAGFSRWHGIDRLIEGLSRYCTRESQVGSPSVCIHLLGDGPELESLKMQAKAKGVDDRIIFYGQCGREMMDRVYDECSLAIASLGMHRIGLTVASTLKTREYLAKGMPFIYSGEIDVFNTDPVDFCLELPADDSAVDFQQVVDYHERLYSEQDEEELINRVRQYAEKTISMEKAMQNVIEFIKENCHG